jgi:CRISPR-associated protein Csx16
LTQPRSACQTGAGEWATPARNNAAQRQEHYMSNTYIITRHIGAAEWLRAKCGHAAASVQVIPHLASIDPGATYIGILPLGLAAEIVSGGGRVIGIDLPNLPADLRGKELTPAQMDAAGARLVEYRVTATIADLASFFVMAP